MQAKSVENSFCVRQLTQFWRTSWAIKGPTQSNKRFSRTRHLDGINDFIIFERHNIRILYGIRQIQ